VFDLRDGLDAGLRTRGRPDLDVHTELTPLRRT
jgi:hypothetical protein